jgi:hypothetical protein
MRTCTCRLCRFWVQTDIELTWVEHPRWMGVFTARYEGRLGWCPWPLYREVFASMVGRGLLIESVDDYAGFNRYMLARLVPHPSPNPKGETP